MVTSRSPDANSMRRKYGRIRWNCSKNRSTLMPANMKGTASPAEYTASRNIPCPSVSFAPARVRIPPRIGPMQGDLPMANAAPTRNVPTRLRVSTAP